MPQVILTDARVKALRPRNAAWDVRDGKTRGFGVRVLPSGRRRFFVHCQPASGKARLDDRRRCRGHGCGRGAVAGTAGTGRDPARRGSAARPRRDPLRSRRRGRVRALPAALEAANARRQPVLPEEPDPAPLPRTAGRRHRPPGVVDWFPSLRATPVSADRSMPVLSVVMREAEAMGLRPEGSNPCLGIRRYRRKGRTRFLSDEEIRTLCDRLSAHVEAAPGQVAVVRLLLLTGCRKREILTLRWSDYREGHLHLRNSKTGPRTVCLSPPARRLLEGLERTGEWMFPAARGKGPRNNGWLERFWDTVRGEAGLHGVRLHDLRHYCRIRLTPESTAETGGERARRDLDSGIITGCSGMPTRHRRAGNACAAHVKVECAPWPFPSVSGRRADRRTWSRRIHDRATMQ